MFFTTCVTIVSLSEENNLICLNTGNLTICAEPLRLPKTMSVQPFEVFMFKIWTDLNKNPPIRFTLSFMGQGQLGRFGKLAICLLQIKEFRKPSTVVMHPGQLKDSKKDS